MSLKPGQLRRFRRIDRETGKIDEVVYLLLDVAGICRDVTCVVMSVSGPHTSYMGGPGMICTGALSWFEEMTVVL